MIQKDYILRLTEEIGRIIAAIAGKNIEEALEYIDENYDTWLHMSREDIDAIPTEKLIEVLAKEKNIAINRLELLAELLAKEGELLHQEGRLEESRRQLEKSLVLFDYIAAEQQTFDFMRMEKLNAIRVML